MIYRRGLLGLIVCAVALCLILPWSLHKSKVSAAIAIGSGPLIAVNDEVIASPKYEAIMDKGTLYVPAVLTAKAMGASAAMNKNTLVISDKTHKLSLPKNDPNTVIHGSVTMVKLRLLAQQFGYTVSMPANEVYRVTNGSRKLTDAQFLDKYKKLISDHAAAQPPKPVVPTQPTAPAKPAGSSGQGGKVIYLTIDDGPTAHTGKLLDILDKYNVKATFFMLGPGIQKYPAYTARTAKAGHGLALHGITHDAKKIYASPNATVNEMKQDQSILYKATGVKSNIIRTPYGSKPYLKASYRDKLAANGFHLWDWNVDSNDWKYTKNPEHFINIVMQEVSSLDKKGIVPIVLIHDKPSTISVLPQLLEGLKKKNYTFKILTEQDTPMNFWNDER